MREGNYAILLFSVTEVSQASHLQEEDITPLFDMLRTGHGPIHSQNYEKSRISVMFTNVLYDNYTNHKIKQEAELLCRSSA